MCYQTAGQVRKKTESFEPDCLFRWYKLVIRVYSSVCFAIDDNDEISYPGVAARGPNTSERAPMMTSIR